MAYVQSFFEKSFTEIGAILAPPTDHPRKLAPFWRQIARLNIMKIYLSTYKDWEVPFVKVFFEKTFNFSEKFSLLLMVVEKSLDF